MEEGDRARYNYSVCGRIDKVVLEVSPKRRFKISSCEPDIEGVPYNKRTDK